MTNPSDQQQWPLLFLGCFLLFGNSLYGEAPKTAQEKQGKNTIFTDLNPPLLMLFYYPLGIRGIGLEFGYARDLPRGFSLMGDVSFITLTQWDAEFSVWDFALYGRYGMAKTRAATVFVSTKAGALLYASPYYQGAAFVTGLEISIRFDAGAHFMIEPYAACNVYTDDRSLMPFTMGAPTELLIPGFKLGARLGAIF